jgi:hypothetical protein
VPPTADAVAATNRRTAARLAAGLRRELGEVLTAD